MSGNATLGDAITPDFNPKAFPDYKPRDLIDTEGAVCSIR